MYFNTHNVIKRLEKFDYINTISSIVYVIIFQLLFDLEKNQDYGRRNPFGERTRRTRQEPKGIGRAIRTRQTIAHENTRTRVQNYQQRKWHRTK